MKSSRYVVLISLIALLSACSNKEETSSTVSSSESSDPSISISTYEGTPLLPKHPLLPVYSYSFPHISKDEMPIGAWVAPWRVGEKNFQTIEQYRTIKEAGLNTIYGLYESYGLNTPYVFDALSLAEQAGIGYLVRDGSLGAYSEDIDEFKSHMDQYTAYSSFAGILAVDEPGSNQFPSLGVQRKMMRQYYTKYAYYVNTFPTYASSAQFSGDTDSDMGYDEYASLFLDTVQPQMFSFDYYGISGEAPNISKGYFEQIYKVKTFADSRRIPFWPFIQACSYGGRSRVPTKEEIYWQVGANLVYGAKGIQYFCYQTPAEAGDWGGNFIDDNGNKTALFPYFQMANSFISSIDAILMNSTLVDMIKTGEGIVPTPENQTFVSSSRELSSVESTSPVLVGVFSNEGKTVLYVFNNSTTDASTVDLSFSSLVDASIYTFDAAQAETALNKITISLKAGESALVEITNYQ